MENIVCKINSLTNNFNPEIGVILGSGLGGFTSKVDVRYDIPYKDIEGFPISTVEGHDGRLLFGYIGDKRVIVMKGRFHYYEGYSASTITLPIRVMRRLGVNTILLSNAAGAINKSYRVGDIMLLKNHINFIPNPLIGHNDASFGVRFPDMKHPYSSRLNDIAKAFDSTLKDGCYVALTGPSYETAAEINMYRIMGADAVGMSTAPEVIIARHAGMEVFAVSVITNDTSEAEVTHEEVITIGNKAGERMNSLFEHIICSL